MPVIDVHTHMLGREWFEMLRRHGGPHYEIRPSMDVPEAVYCDGAPFLTPQPAHFDYALRIKEMTRGQGRSRDRLANRAVMLLGRPRRQP